mgnify:FL=1
MNKKKERVISNFLEITNITLLFFLLLKEINITRRQCPDEINIHLYTCELMLTQSKYYLVCFHFNKIHKRLIKFTSCSATINELYNYCEIIFAVNLRFRCESEPLQKNIILGNDIITTFFKRKSLL